MILQAQVLRPTCEPRAKWEVMFFENRDVATDLEAEKLRLDYERITRDSETVRIVALSGSLAVRHELCEIVN